MLGVEKVIWLPGDPDAYETDGHVEGIACFVRPVVVLYETSPDETAPHSQAVRENYEALRPATDAKGRGLELIAMEEAHDIEKKGISLVGLISIFTSPTTVSSHRGVAQPATSGRGSCWHGYIRAVKSSGSTSTAWHQAAVYTVLPDSCRRFNESALHYLFFIFFAAGEYATFESTGKDRFHVKAQNR